MLKSFFFLTIKSVHFNFFKFKSMPARSFYIGLASYCIGTYRIMNVDNNEGVFAALAMGLNGIVTSLLIPVLVKYFFIIPKYFAR